jgi:hypothetical protein
MKTTEPLDPIYLRFIFSIQVNISTDDLFIHLISAHQHQYRAHFGHLALKKLNLVQPVALSNLNSFA